MRFINYTLIAFIVATLFACNTDRNNLSKETAQPNIDSNNTIDQQKEIPFKVQILKTSNEKDIVLKISNPIGMSLVNIDIIGANFENKIPISLIDIDPINKIELYDMDNDGFDELFIFTNAAGSGSYGEIYAFSSNKGIRLKAIDVANFKYDDYQGHDSFILRKNKLIRTFKVDNTKETDSISYIYNGSSLIIE